MDIGRVPEVICTDPDGNSESDIEKEILACELGSIVLIHAHGDNIDKLKNTYPISNALLPLLRQGLLKSVQFQQIRRWRQMYFCSQGACSLQYQAGRILY